MARRKNKFTDEMAREFPQFKKAKYDSEALCEICNTVINVSNKGKCDLIQHLNSTKHKQKTKSIDLSSKVTDFVVVQKTSHLKAVFAAEAALAFHVVAHHHSYKSTDCSHKLFKHIFPDSEIAQKISCARTKTEAIINGVVGPHSLDIICKTFEREDIHYIGVSTDGSNFQNLKLFPVLAQYFDPVKGIQVRLLTFNELKDETSESITALVHETLKNYSLDKMCRSYSGDNTNSNFGGLHRNGENNVFFSSSRPIKKN